MKRKTAGAQQKKIQVQQPKIILIHNRATTNAKIEAQNAYQRI